MIAISLDGLCAFDWFIRHNKANFDIYCNILPASYRSISEHSIRQTSLESHENWERSPKKCMLIFAIISGDEVWNGQCSSGRRQSPIDLAEDASVIGRYPNLYFKNYDKLFKNARIINTGHSRKFTIFIVSPVYDRSMKSTKNEVFERAKENR